MNTETLKLVLSKKFGASIVRVDYRLNALQGGTLGDVQLVTGVAEVAGGEKRSYKVVWKRQQKWERYGDSDSWRREYDLYSSDLGSFFTESFCRPECYLTEMNACKNEISIWMEYIDGVSGLHLTGEMYENAAYELGRFQGRLKAEKPVFLQNITNLSSVDYVKKFYLHYRSWNVVYDYIRSDDCGIPKHLCEMLISIDSNADEIFRRIEELPIVFCHRDFRVANILCSGNKTVLIDWDTAGWGYLGEDIASLIADEADVEHMVDYYHACVSAYCKGISEYIDVSHISDYCIRDFMLLLFGYRFVEWYLHAKSPKEKMLQLNTLQKIYEM